MKSYLSIFIIALGFLITSCGGGGSSSAPVDGATISIEGVWTISETSKTGNCAVPAPAETFDLTVTQDGNNITIVDEDSNSFSGTLSGQNLSWSGSYPDAAPDGTPGTTTLNSMTAIIDASCNSLSGSASWSWIATDGSGYSCSGTTEFSGIRTPASGCDIPDDAGLPSVPTQLSANVLSSTVIEITWVDNSDDEDNFIIERAIDNPAAFVQIASLADNIESYADLGLSPSTTYYYRVKATNAVGGSDYSSLAQATTFSAATVAPVAPTNLVATALDSNNVKLDWMDMASNEDEYRVERGLVEGSYFEIDKLTPNSTTYTDSSGIQGGTTYYYRVVAVNSAGSNSATTSATTPDAAPDDYTLTVNRVGVGTGSVIGSGIDCGSDCTHTAVDGTTIVLTATPDAGSSFSSWTGCDIVNLNACTVNLTSDKLVTASFNQAFSTNITLNLPTTSETGDYTLLWTVSGLASTSYRIDEDSDISFSSPTTYYYNNAVSPYSYPFSGKSNGTYCYRVGMSWAGQLLWSEPKCITVAINTAAVLRIINNTKYDMIDIVLNGEQQVGWGLGIPPGGSNDFVFNTGGGVSVSYGVGFYDYVWVVRDIWFTGSANVTLTSGQTYSLTANNPTLGNMLTNFSTTRNWDGYYYCYNGCPILYNTTRFTFTNTGSWTFYRNGVQEASGVASLVDWPIYGSTISFSLCPTCGNTNLYHPFAIFSYPNGVPEWPNVEYTMQ